MFYTYIPLGIGFNVVFIFASFLVLTVLQLMIELNIRFYLTISKLVLGIFLLLVKA